MVMEHRKLREETREMVKWDPGENRKDEE